MVRKNIIILKRAPFKEEDRFRRHLEEFLSIQNPNFRRGPIFRPAADVVENECALVVTLELAGVRAEDVKVIFGGDYLAVQGIRKSQQGLLGDSYHLMEIAYGPFEKVIFLPFEVDPEQITATYENGLLEIVLSKVEKGKTRTIEIE